MIEKDFNTQAFESRSQCCDPQTQIETRDLTLSYKGKPAFKNINLTINRGCITAVVGPSGCGKTSFLNCLNRLSDLMPHCEVSGEVLFDSKNIHEKKYDVGLLRRRVGMIFQKPNPFPLSIKKNLLFPLKEHGVRDPKEAEAIMEQVLMHVGLWNEVKDRLDAAALSLSGGQQQRLCIARALALKPEVLLMDEPCSALDPISGSKVEGLITQLQGAYTIVIVTHNLAQAKRIANFAALFWFQEEAGVLVEQGTALQIFDSPKNEITRAYIQGVRG
ncbi:MAG: phosphate ABC transporter ATP-binding protein [Deltaproteobacteria bacterium]|nr:phosphate ABC transporter ATP-binding protein [Deltaproteobacteria bacterium]